MNGMMDPRGSTPGSSKEVVRDWWRTWQPLFGIVALYFLMVLIVWLT